MVARADTEGSPRVPDGRSDAGPDTLSHDHALGSRVRTARQARSMTLVQLARRCDLSHSFLSQVERGRARPSITSLARIAHALGTSQIELLAEPTSDADIATVVAASDAARGTYGDEEARLLVTRSDAHFRPLSITGVRRDYGEPFVHEEHEFLHVIAGRIEVEIQGRRQRLEAGDSVYYGSSVPHRWRAVDAAGFHIFVVKDAAATHPREDPS